MGTEKETAIVVHQYERYADRVTDVVASIDKAVDSIARRHRDWLVDVAVAAASCVLSATKYGNIASPNKLIDALTGMRKAALIEWFITFGPLDYDVEAEAFSFNKDKRDVIKARLEKDGGHLPYARKMLSNPFWEWKPEPKYKPFDLKAILAKAIATAAKRESKHDDRDNLAGLEALRMFYQSTFGNDNDDNPAGPAKSDNVATDKPVVEVKTVGARKKAA